MTAARILALLAAMTMALAAQVQAGTVGHCLDGEEALFSCQIKGKTKVLSVCASDDLGPGRGSIQYRFGEPGQIEMTYPVDKKGSRDAFRMSSYSRSMVSYTSLSFENKGVGYVVYDDYNGEEGRDEYASGVKVILQDGREIDIPCAGVTRNLWQAEGAVPVAEE